MSTAWRRRYPLFAAQTKAQWSQMPWGTIWDFSATPVAWISDQAMQEAGLGWPGSDEARMVREYDPSEVVTIILRDDGGVSSYRMSMPGRPSPPQAYELMKDELERRRIEP